MRLKLAYALSLIGLYLTWMLSASYLIRIRLPCGENDGCMATALSPAGHLWTIPTPVFGLVFYGLLAVVIGHALWKPSSAKPAYAIAIVGAAVSTGLTVYGVVALHATCAWCLASNVTACFLAGLLAIDPRELSGARSTYQDAPSRQLQSLEEAPSPANVEVCRNVTSPLNCHNTMGTSPGVKPRLVSRDNPLWVLSLGVIALILASVLSTLKLEHGNRRFPYNPVLLAETSEFELAPPDSIIIPARPGEPTVVIFLDLECPACQGAFQDLSETSQANGLGLAVRHRPIKIHTGAFALAVLCEEAQVQNKGLDFIQGAFRDHLDNRKDGLGLLTQLQVKETPKSIATARQLVLRDRTQAMLLGLNLTPSIFLLRQGHSPQPVTTEELKNIHD